jgi:ribosomal protein S18 acetylase RimI-like enzyme
MAALPMADITIITLTQVDQNFTDPLFNEQCCEWMSRLRWDYTEPSRLVRGVLGKGELTGLVAVVGGAPAGVSFYVVEGTRASIGDIYVSERYRSAGIDKRLVFAVLSNLETLPRLRRIESQSVSFDNHGADEVFVARGFERFERRFMLSHLTASDLLPESTESSARGRLASGQGQLTEPDQLAGGPGQLAGPDQRAASPGQLTARSRQLAAGSGTIRIRPWHEDDYGAAVRTIFKSYRGEDDSRINSQYSSEEGCAELLSILTDTVWCGQFLPEASRVAACSVTGNQVGVLIASRMSPDTGHLGQISVSPAYQGRGIGRRLIASAKDELFRRGFACVSLAVTATNKRALALYESCGFSTIHSFPVYYWKRK